MTAVDKFQTLCLELRPDGKVVFNGEAVATDCLSFSFGYSRSVAGPHLNRHLKHEMTEMPLELPDWGCLTQGRVSAAGVQLLTDHASAYPLYEASLGSGGYVITTDAWDAARLGRLRNIDPVAAFGLLGFEYVPGQDTLVDGLTEIPPASRVFYEYKEAGWHRTEKNVWRLERLGAPRLASTAEAFDNLHQVMKPLTAIDSGSGNGPLAINLSGGWDSRAILAGVMRLKIGGVFACSYGNPEYSGIRIAGKVAAVAGVRHEIFPFHNADFLRENYLRLCRMMPPVTRFNLADGALALGQHFYGETRAAICGHNGDGFTGVPAWVLCQALDSPDKLADGIDRKMRGAFRSGLYQGMFSNAGNAMQEAVRHRLEAQVETLFSPGVEGFLRWKSLNRVRRITAVELRMLERFTPVVFVPMLDRQFMEFWMNVADEQLASQRLYRQMLADRWFTGDLSPLARIPRESGGHLRPGGWPSRMTETGRTQAWRVLRRIAPARTARLTAADPTALWWHEDPDLRQWAWDQLENSKFVRAHFNLDALQKFVLSPKPQEPSFARIGIWNLLTVVGVEQLLAGDGGAGVMGLGSYMF